METEGAFNSNLEESARTLQLQSRKGVYFREMPTRYECRALLRLGDPEIWLALQSAPLGLERAVIVKRARSRETREDIQREAVLASHLSHPNLVQVIDTIHEESADSLVMELVDGVTFETMLRHVQQHESAVPPEVAARLVADIAAGLRHVHENRAELGVVHRDVAPSNLLVTVEGFAKLGDFGIAKSRLAETQVGRPVRGTLGYLSPEQAAGEAVDHRSDIFSLGVVLHELLLGVPLLEGSTVAEQLKRFVVNPPTLPRDVPEDLAQLVREMLAAKPQFRPDSMATVAQRLEEHAIGLGGSRREIRHYLCLELDAVLTERRENLRRSIGGGDTPAAGVAVDLANSSFPPLSRPHGQPDEQAALRPFGADELEPTTRDDKLWKKFRRRD